MQQKTTATKNVAVVVAGSLVCKYGMLGFPLHQLDVQPETINTKGDDGQKEPLNPVAKKLQCGTGEFQSVAANNGVLCFPAVDHANCPGVADSEGKCGYQSAENLPADQLQQAAIEVGVLGLDFHKYTSNSFFSGDNHSIPINPMDVNKIFTDY